MSAVDDEIFWREVRQAVNMVNNQWDRVMTLERTSKKAVISMHQMYWEPGESAQPTCVIKITEVSPEPPTLIVP